MSDYRVFLYRSWQSSAADIDVCITAADPAEALLSLMQRFGISSVALGHVWESTFLVGTFTDVTLPPLSDPSGCLVSYDYSL